PLSGETTNDQRGSLRKRTIRCSGRVGTFARTRTFFATMHGNRTRSGKCRNYVALALVIAAAAGCASVPDADEDIAAAAAASSPRPTILGTDGPLTIAESHRLLVPAGQGKSQDGVLQGHLAIEQVVAGTPLTAGNQTQLLKDGEGTFDAVFAAIGAARHHVNLEYYTLEDVTYQGRRLSDLLIAKRRA